MNAHQLDLFLDSREVALVNEVVAALCAHDSERAAQGTARLRAEVPAHRDLDDFASLQAFLALFGQLCRDADLATLDQEALVEVLEILDTQIIPCANVLGAAAKGFLGFFWRQLARVANHPFDPARPQLHAADLFLHAEAYDAVEEAANAIVGHSTQRAVLRWRAVARHRLSGLKSARRQIFLLAWHAPSAFQGLLKELNDPLLDRNWLDFQSDLDDLDASWFPAWYLLRYPEAASDIGAALAQSIDKDSQAVPAAQACFLLTRILDLEKLGHSRALVEQRARLRAIDGGFFAAYMRSRSVQQR